MSLHYVLPAFIQLLLRGSILFFTPCVHICLHYILPEYLFPPIMLLAALKQVKSKLTLQIEKMSVKSRGKQIFGTHQLTSYLSHYVIRHLIKHRSKKYLINKNCTLPGWLLVWPWTSVL